jgi:GH15 family glucan-1,4-alpha-glucosidase
MASNYQPIDHYGVIGDLHSAALVGLDGSIDWCCLPRFDSPSVFGALLDSQKGGRFKIAAKNEARRKQMYLPDTNVLVTRSLSDAGVGEVIDFMALRENPSDPMSLVRIVRCVRGEVTYRVLCQPAFDYARSEHRLEMRGKQALFLSDSLNLCLDSSVDLNSAPSDDVVDTELNLRGGDEVCFVLRSASDGRNFGSGLRDFASGALDYTAGFWKDWAGRCNYSGRWREIVVRSALVLKLLIYRPTGAIIASPTCSLPEFMGGVRNWDYRYSWIRDAAFTIYALLRLGYTEEAAHFMSWLEGRASDTQDVGPLQVMYKVDGSAELNEELLNHLEGYQGAKPVRIGNAASKQLQLDIYGELIDSIYLYNKYAEPISYDMWVYTRRLVDWVCDNWRRPDHSIWEVRKDPQQYVYSKVQCWVALDRGMRIALKRNLPLDIQRVRRELMSVYETVMKEGWNSELNSFVQTLGGNSLDSTSMLMPLMLFLSPADPRLELTLNRLRERLLSDSLVYRYEFDDEASDGLPGREGTFSACTFWLVEVLARSRRFDEARYIFEKMLTYANHLGLFAEQIGPTGDALGNFPQAFTHLGLIAAALDLDRWLGETDRNRRR